MIADTITKKIGQALKARDEIRLSTLRMLSSALNYEKIEKQHDLNEEEELAVVKREAKKRKDAIEVYQKLQNSETQKVKERIKREEEELAILKGYLPEEMGESELVDLVDQVIGEIGAESMQDMGNVMGEVMKRAKGRADGKTVADLVKKQLT